MIYTSDLLLASIKTRAMIPSSQNTFQDSDLLNLANEEMETFIVGTLMRVQEEYLVVTDTVPLISGQVRYRIPSRAIGGKLRDIVMATSTGNISIPRYSRENIPQNASVMSILGFYVEGNYLVLAAPPSDNLSSLLVSYFIRPGKIVDSTQYQVASVVDQINNVITVPAILPSFTVGTLLDVITAKSGSETIIKDAAITAIDAINKKITVNQTCALVSVGDYLCLAGQSAVPQCPEEMHPLLAERVICRVLESLNDVNGLNMASQKVKEMELNILALIDTRVVGKPRKIVNRSGLLSIAAKSNPRLTR